MPPEDDNNNNNQSEANEGGGDDRIKNLQAEFSRKTSNVEAQVAKLAEANNALLRQIQSLTAPAAPAKKKMSDLIYENPDEAVAQITQTATENAWKRFEEHTARQQKQSNTISELYGQYPELADPNHEMTKKSLERYGNMSDSEKADPRSLRLAALETAAEMGVKPKSRRSEDDESYSLPSGGSGAPRKRDNGKLPAEMLDFARLAGLDVSKPEVMERLKKRAKRQTWNRYE